MQQGTAAAGSPRTPSVHAHCQRLPGGSPEGSPVHVPQSTTTLSKRTSPGNKSPSPQNEMSSGVALDTSTALYEHYRLSTNPRSAAQCMHRQNSPLPKTRRTASPPVHAHYPDQKHTSPSFKSPSPRNKIVFWLALDAYLDQTSPTGSPKAPIVCVR